MTQAPPDRLDRIETTVEQLSQSILGMDKKLDIFIAKTDERFNSIDLRFSAIDTQLADLKKSTDTQLADLKKSTDTQLTDIKIQLRSQDTRLWGFIVTLSLAVIGFLSKLAFFPTGQM
jgi:hypothetical protein